MLPFKNRLTRREDFQKLYRRGVLVFSGDLSLKYAPNDLKDSRIGIALEKKYFKKATARNRIKRLLRESAQHFLPRLRPGLDIAIFCRDAGKIGAFSKSLAAVETLLKKSELIK